MLLFKPISPAEATTGTTLPYLQAAQSKHVLDGLAMLYFPTTQVVHVPPFCPVNPVLQTQAVTEVCPMSACPEFDGQL